MADFSSDGMLQQAQHIWQMLDDMAQNDLQAYRRYSFKIWDHEHVHNCCHFSQMKNLLAHVALTLSKSKR